MDRRRRRWGVHPQRSDRSAQPRKLPEYLEANEVEAIIRAADNPRAKLLMIKQWRPGKGNRSRTAPMHRELQAACRLALSYVSVRPGSSTFTPSTAWCWVKAAVRRAAELRAIAPGRKISTHRRRHSFARRLLMNRNSDQLQEKNLRPPLRPSRAAGAVPGGVRPAQVDIT